MLNPFQYGDAVPPAEFIEPSDSILQDIVGKIIDHGQSTAIVGEPRFGKTSLLSYLKSNKVLAGIRWLDEQWEHVFRFIDAHMFMARDVSQAKFWRYAVAPIPKYAEQPKYQALMRPYRDCESEEFDVINVEDLLTTMEECKLRLVLLIDEFDDLLAHPVLGTGEFFGHLRSFATRKDSLALVITSRKDVGELNEETKNTHKSGSPYFNYFNQVTLGPFTEEATTRLFDRAKGRFSDSERQTLVHFAGRHPYFLQVAAHTLWESCKDPKKKMPGRMMDVWSRLCEQCSMVLDDTWGHWNLETRQIFTIIALDDMPRFLGTSLGAFDLKALRESLNGCPNELRFLLTRGFVGFQHERYTLASRILAWWLAGKLITSLRSQDELGSWLNSESREGVLKPRQREQLLRIGKSLAKFLDDNKDVFIGVVVDLLKKGA